MMAYPKALQQLILMLKKLPGVGTRTAERYAFSLLEWRPEQRAALAQHLNALTSDLCHCAECHALCDVQEGCPFCCEARRQSRRLCVVARARDLYAIEATGEYRGLYHILGGLLSPIDGVAEEQLHIASLQRRVAELQVDEVILALDATLEGDTTALLLKDRLSGGVATVTRLAFGIPMGSSFDSVDGGTLARAVAARNKY